VELEPGEDMAQDKEHPPHRLHCNSCLNQWSWSQGRIWLRIKNTSTQTKLKQLSKSVELEPGEDMAQDKEHLHTD
jgi:hypothetical protein